MNTYSLKVVLIALALAAMGTTHAGMDQETLLSWWPKADALISLPESKRPQNALNFVRDTILCSIIANTVISKNNNLARVGISAAGSLVGSLVLHHSYEKEANTTSRHVPESKSASTPDDVRKMFSIQKLIAWSTYFAGQNVLQIIDFAKDSTYRKNIVKAVWNTLFANRDRSEWLAIFVRNFGPLFMHYTPTGQALSDSMPKLPSRPENAKP